MPRLLDSLRMMMPHGVVTPREVRSAAGLAQQVNSEQMQYAQAQASAMQSRSDVWEAMARAQQQAASTRSLADEWDRLNQLRSYSSLYDVSGQVAATREQVTRNAMPTRTSTIHQHLSNRLSSISYALSIGADVGIIPDDDGEPWLAIKLPHGYSFSQTEDKPTLEARLNQPLAIYCQMSNTVRVL